MGLLWGFHRNAQNGEKIKDLAVSREVRSEFWGL